MRDSAYKFEYRCGYCGTPGKEGRCIHCGSAMDDEAYAIEGAKHPHLIRRWLKSRDRGWDVADGMRAELSLRHMEDIRESRDPKRFDGIPDPMDPWLDPKP